MHREHHIWRFHWRAHARRKHLSTISSSASSSGEAPHRSARSRQIPREKINLISSERRRPAIPLGGAGRGRGVEHLAQGGGSSGHRSWPEKPGDGGGDPGHQRDRGEREESEWGWAGSVDRPRPEPGQLSRARVGRLGQLANWAKLVLANCFKTKFQIQI
jgi:hypothetical protein